MKITYNNEKGQKNVPIIESNLRKTIVEVPKEIYDAIYRQTVFKGHGQL